jgi:hypothetical protein
VALRHAMSCREDLKRFTSELPPEVFAARWGGAAPTDLYRDVS